MRIPQTAERLKEAPAQALRAVLAKEAPAQQALRAVLSREAPAHALRAVFSGVGQVLLVTERVRRRAKAGGRETAPAARVAGPAGTAAPPATAPAQAGTAAPPATAPAQAGTAAPPATGSTQAGPPAPAEASPAKDGKAEASTSAAKPSTAKASTPKASAPKASPAKGGTAAAVTPPIPQYSELSVASLRARMRGLDAAQLRELVSYERAHEDRETVIAMFERRIAKLEAGGPAAG